MKLILCITNVVAAVLWPDICVFFFFFSSRLLSLQEMKCDFYSLHGSDLYGGHGLSHDNT